VSDRPRVLVDLGVELDRAARETFSADSTTTRKLARRRWWRWRAVPAVLLLVLAGGAAAFATGLFSFGAPVKATPVFSNPRAGLGALTPGTVRLIPIATADPQGGPAWGLRVLSTTRGAGCVQVGRLVDGKLVALGQDGAFGDDGRAHALPVSAAVNSFSCVPLDGNDRFFNSVTMLGQTASAAWWLGSTTCIPTGTLGATSRAHPACPQRDERNLYYGLLGPDAKSVTYKLAGDVKTQATVGPEGAYLIVTASNHQHIANSGGGIADDVPVYSPITSIQYRNGATCRLLTAHKWIVGFHACSPSLREPVGYVAVSAPTAAQIATPIHATVIHTSVIRVPARVIQTSSRVIRTRAQAIHIPARYEIVVSFKSHVAIVSLRGQYQLEWHNKRMQPGVDGYTTIGGNNGPSIGGEFLGAASAGADIAAGQTLTATIGEVGPALASGVTSGTITLNYSTGPSLDGAQPTRHIPVGSFTVRIP
jgi:hypothetical protein